MKKKFATTKKYSKMYHYMSVRDSLLSGIRACSFLLLQSPAPADNSEYPAPLHSAQIGFRWSPTSGTRETLGVLVMNGKLFLLLFFFLSTSTVLFADEFQESQLPWPQEITTIAKKSIYLSIENLSSPDETSSSRFPEGRQSQNFNFPYKESEDFKIVGYTVSDDVYTIYFQGIEFDGFGPSIAVEIDLAGGKWSVNRVYIKADA